MAQRAHWGSLSFKAEKERNAVREKDDQKWRIKKKRDTERGDVL